MKTYVSCPESARPKSYFVERFGRHVHHFVSSEVVQMLEWVVGEICQILEAVNESKVWSRGRVLFCHVCRVKSLEMVTNLRVDVCKT